MDERKTTRADEAAPRKMMAIAVAVVLAFFALPIAGVILQGGGAAALRGLGIIDVLIAVQYPLMRLIVRRKK